MAILNDKEKSQEIPSSNNIFSIVSTQFSDVNKIVKAISGSMLKASDVVKIKIGVKATKLGIRQIVKGYLEINSYLESQKVNETIELVNTLVSDPVKFIKMMKDPNRQSFQETRNKENLAIFENFVQIINYIAMISEYSNKVSFIGLLLLPKRVDSAMKAIMVSLNVIRKKSKRIGLIAEATSKFINSVPDIFRVLLGMNEHLNMFVEASKKVTKKEAKKAIRQFFSMYFYIALELFKIGKFLLTGEYTAEESTWFGLRTKKVEYNFKGNILKQVAVGSLFMAMATGVIVAMKIASDQISGISKNSKRVVKGLKALDLMLFGHPSKDDKKRVKGLITIISVIGINHRKTPYVKAIFYISLMSIFVVQVTALSLLMGVIGNNKKDIGRGLVSLDTIFFGGLLCRGLLNIINDLGDETKFKTIFKASKAILYLALLNIALTEISIISIFLSQIGESKKNIKSGLKTISVIFFGKEKLIGKNIEGLIGIIQSVTETENLIKNALNFTLYNAILAVSLTIFMKTANILFGIGALNKKIRSGLKTIDYVFFGDLGPNRKYTEAKPKTKLGIIQIIHAVTEQITLGELVGFTLFSIGMSWSFKLLQDIADTLIEFGRHKRKIIKGLKVLNTVLFGKYDGKDSFPGIIGILKNKQLKKLTIKEALTASIKLTIISLAFFNVSVFVGLLGVFALGAALAVITIDCLNIAIISMIRGLKIIEHVKINVVQAALSLEKMTLAYRTLAEGIQKIGQSIKPADLLKATAFIIVSPLIMYLMRFCIKPMADPKIVTIATNGSKSLGLLSAAYGAFALALVGISAAMLKINLSLIIPFILTLGLMGLVIAGLGMASAPIIAGCIVLGAMSLAMIVFAGALLILSAAIIVFALAFQILRMILPSDDVINEVVTGVVTLVAGVGKIVDALFEHINIGKAFLGMFAAGFVAIILVLLIVDVVLFIVIGSLAKAITDEMINSTIRAIGSIAVIVNKIYETVNPIVLIASIFIVLGYMILMVLLFVTITLTFIVSAVAKVIDYRALRKNLGLDDERGLIPILADTINAINDNIKIIAVSRALIRVGLALGVVGALGGIAFAVKGLSTLEIPLYDENGKRIGEKILMKEEDFKRAQTNAQKTLETVTGIFFDENGKPTKTMDLLGQIKFKTVAQMTGLKIILATFGSMSKTIANMSKLVVPDETKGFDDKGKPLGWRQMSSEDFDKFGTNTEKMFLAITSVFNEDTATGKKVAKLLKQVSITSTIKMKLIGMTVGTIGTIANTISKIAKLVVPDTSDPNYINEKGEIVKWKQFDSLDMLSMETNISELMLIVGKIIDKVKESDLENIKMKTIKKFSKVMEGIRPISELIDTIIKIGTGQFPQIKFKNGEVEIDEKTGQPKTTYINFDDIPFESINTNIKDIIEKYVDNVGGLFKNASFRKKVKKLNKSFKEGLPTAGISDLIEHIIKIGTGQFPMMVLNGDGTPEIDPKTGQPKMKYVEIDNTLITNASTNISNIIKNYIDELYKVISDKSDFAESFKTKMDSLNTVFNGSSNIFTIIDPLVNNAEKIIKIGEVNSDKFGATLIKMISSYDTALTFIDPKNYNKWHYVEDDFNSFTSATQNLYKNLDNKAIPLNIERTYAATQKLLDKVNGMNPTKLEKMADISSNMAKFSTSINGNFDGLAKAMNENIVTALEKVQKSMEELKEFLETLPDELSNSMSKVKVQTVPTGKPTPDKPAPVVKDPHEERTPDNKPKKETVVNQIDTLEELVIELGKCIQDGAIKTRR